MFVVSFLGSGLSTSTPATKFRSFMSLTDTTTSAEDDVLEVPVDNAIHLTIPPRFYLVPGAAVIVGTAIGLMRGAQATSLQFLAENAHRPPTTVQGWYFYKKTKNYKVMLGGLKGAGAEASKLALVATGWVAIEEGLERVGWGQAKEVGAAVGTAGMFSAVCEWVSRFFWSELTPSCAIPCVIFLPYRPITVESDSSDSAAWVDNGKQFEGSHLGKRPAPSPSGCTERKSL